MPLSNRKSKIASLLLLAALALLALAPLFFTDGTEGKTREAVVTVDGKIIRRVPLARERDEIFTVSTPYGENRIAVSGGSIRVEGADCPAKICAKSGAISQIGEVIACLPHKLLIEIKEMK